MSGTNISELGEARFADLVAAYGADPARWPADERERAQRLLSSSAAAQGLLAQARILDAALASATLRPNSPTFESRLLNDFDRSRRGRPLREWIGSLAHTVWPGAPLWQPVAVFGLALMLGIAVAILAPLDLRSGEDNSASVFALDTPSDGDAGQDI